MEGFQSYKGKDVVVEGLYSLRDYISEIFARTCNGYRQFPCPL